MSKKRALIAGGVSEWKVKISELLVFQALEALFFKP
jgi:hypothetical protein